VAAPLALAALAGAGVAGAVASVGSGTVEPTAERTVAVARGIVQSTVSGAGNLSPANQLDLSFGAGGVVKKIYVKTGRHVSPGQLLATIDPSSAEVDLAQARATMRSAERALAAARAPGTAVSTTAGGARTGAVVARAAAIPVASAAQDVTTQPTTATALPASTVPAPTTTQAPATAPKTTAPAGTTTNAAPAATTTNTPPAATTTNAAPAATTTNAAPPRTTIPKATSRPRAASSAKTTTTRQGAGATRSAGGAGATSVASATAAVESARLAVAKAEAALAATRLRAPMAGTVAAVDGAVGDVVGSGSSGSASSATADAGGAAAVAGGLGGGGAGSGSGSSSGRSGFITLAQLSRFALQVSLSESDIGKVKVGQAATVTVNAAAGAQFAGRVKSVGVLASTSSGSGAVSYPVTVRIDQSATKLKAGMSATADIVVAEAAGLSVPSQAVSGSSVTVVLDGKRSSRRVQTGIVGDASTQIVSGLTEGEQVVVRSPSAAAGALAGARGRGLQQTGIGGAVGGGGAFPGGGGFRGRGFGGANRGAGP
jgi:multidrug efflux pump subunit AcrA (membrane-fusion protein)